MLQETPDIERNQEQAQHLPFSYTFSQITKLLKPYKIHCRQVSDAPFDFTKAKKLRDTLMQNLKYSEDRKEVRVITKEISRLIKKIIDQKNISREEKVEKMQACYSEGMDTLLLLVGRECIERGTVLMKIWNSNLILLQTFLQVLIKERNELKHNLDGIVMSIRNEYQSKYDEARGKYEVVSQKYEKLLPEVEMLTVTKKIKIS